MGDFQGLEDSCSGVRRRVFAETAYSTALYKILSFCVTPRSLSEIEQEVRSYSEMKTALQSPRTCLSWLVQAGGIEQIVQADANEEDSTWRTTPAGMDVVHSESPGNRINDLLAVEPTYAKIYELVLQACATPKSRSEIESMLCGNPALEKPKVYPSFFIEALERAGGIEWHEKWRTTQAGNDFLNAEALTSTPTDFPSSKGKE